MLSSRRLYNFNQFFPIFFKHFAKLYHFLFPLLNIKFLPLCQPFPHNFLLVHHFTVSLIFWKGSAWFACCWIINNETTQCETWFPCQLFYEYTLYFANHFNIIWQNLYIIKQRQTFQFHKNIYFPLLLIMITK
jgi:hypothetical protein